MKAEIDFIDEQGAMFNVKGETDNYICHIWSDTDEAFCNCPSFFYRKKECKHIKLCREVLDGSN